MSSRRREERDSWLRVRGASTPLRVSEGDADAEEEAEAAGAAAAAAADERVL
jgi:hypothetical protein